MPDINHIPPARQQLIRVFYGAIFQNLQCTEDGFYPTARARTDALINELFALQDNVPYLSDPVTREQVETYLVTINRDIHEERALNEVFSWFNDVLDVDMHIADYVIDTALYSAD